MTENTNQSFLDKKIISIGVSKKQTLHASRETQDRSKETRNTFHKIFIFTFDTQSKNQTMKMYITDMDSYALQSHCSKTFDKQFLFVNKNVSNFIVVLLPLQTKNQQCFLFLNIPIKEIDGKQSHARARAHTHSFT